MTVSLTVWASAPLLPLGSNLLLLLVIGTGGIAPTLAGGISVQAGADRGGGVDSGGSPVLALDVAGVIRVGGSRRGTRGDHDATATEGLGLGFEPDHEEVILVLLMAVRNACLFIKHV